MPAKMTSKITIGLVFCAALFAQPKVPVVSVTYQQDVYAISPYGDCPRMNPLWWASDQTAVDVAAKIGAGAVPRDTTPQTGPPLARWHVTHVQASLIPPGGQRIIDNHTLLMLMASPPARMWAAHFPSGCEVNLGYLANGFERNSIMQDGGLRYVQQIIAGECAVSGSAPNRTKLTRQKYPPIFADGKKHLIKP